ncbi:peptide mating pheromone precursor bbp2-1 [Schizophyllum commune]
MDSFDDLLDFLGAGTSRPAEASARNPLGSSASPSSVSSLAASTSDLLSASPSSAPTSPDDGIMSILADAEHGYGGSNVHGWCVVA